MQLELKRLLLEGEGNTLDFKESITNAHKIAKTIVSFANREGGIVLVGVRDNKTISGIVPEEERFMLQLAVSRYCKPLVELEYQELFDGKKTVLKVKIPEGKNKPYKAFDESGKWRAYYRVEDSSMLASKVWYNAMLKRRNRGGIIQFGEAEKEVLNMLSTGVSDFSTLKNLGGFSEKKLTHLLSNLHYLDFIKFVYIDKKEYYSHIECV